VIFGITGVKRSGKDTYAKALANALKNQDPSTEVLFYAFATPFKDLLVNILNCSPEFLDQLKEGQCSLTIRNKEQVPSYTQFDGRNFVREIGMAIRKANPEYMVEQAAKFFLENPDTHIIFTDVRFGEEAEWIDDINGQLIHIQNANIKSDGHVTEEPLLVCPGDHVVDTTPWDIGLLLKDACEYVSKVVPIVCSR
jgi:hypothetical protein